MKRGKKPTFEEILALDKKLETTYSARDALFVKDEQFYELLINSLLDIPTEFKNESVVLPTGRDLVDTFANHISVTNARVFADKKSTQAIDEDRAEIMRKLYHGLIYKTNTESDISPWIVSKKHYAMHGLTVLKTTWDADKWPDKPVQKDNESDQHYKEQIAEWQEGANETLPIDIEAIHPHAIRPDPYYGRRLYVIERHKHLLYDAQKMWPNFKNPLGKNVEDYVEFLSYWDDTWRCDLVDEQPILRIKGGVVAHKYGFLPYTLIESGLGNVSIDNLPEMRFVGALRYIYDLLVSESRNYSNSDIIYRNLAYGGGTVSGENAANLGEVKKKYGVYQVIPEGVEFKEWDSSEKPEAATNHLYRTQDYLSAHIAPRSSRGLSETGVRSGADRRFISAQASLLFQDAIPGYAHGTAQALIKCAKLIKNVIPGDIRVNANTAQGAFDEVIKKSDLREPFTCYVEFDPISEEDRYVKQDSLMKLWNGGKGLITRAWAWGQMSNVDKKEMELQAKKEDIRMNPAYQQVLATQIQQVAGSAGLLPPPQAEGGGETARGMVPRIPNRAKEGSSEDITNSLNALTKTTESPIQGSQGQTGGGNRG